MSKHTLALALTAALTVSTLPFAASAAGQAVDLAKSEIGFTAKQMGVPLQGQFGKFDAQMAFDPAKPETGKVSFSIDLGSARLGSAETEAELVKAEWFNTAKFPRATFQSTAIKASGPNKFDVTGKLTIKGQSRDVVVPVTLAAAGAQQSIATGGFAMKRLDFKIGDGDWTDTSIVANDVQVKFKLQLQGVAAR
ncbi:polyisoprenoid-binding protein YceI [Sphaerotilus hippei]|uniref:Polyisoprenoid-binding protein YceI n=1 Tax=Sphaerotilus hippei TaxID=744406 RepID=A0A318H3Z5_9BURK|nr:YceI family protein [Sphaerotilus hippei]PXW95850.1 polyisoprenoid-binding protein YceI [Sphaerotilus hippei]